MQHSTIYGTAMQMNMYQTALLGHQVIVEQGHSARG